MTYKNAPRKLNNENISARSLLIIINISTEWSFLIEDDITDRTMLRRKKTSKGMIINVKDKSETNYFNVKDNSD